MAGLGVATICSESLHYHPSSTATRTSATSCRSDRRCRYLLGLCFCKHCLAAARRRGVDGDAVRRAAREEIERVFAGGEEPPVEELERDELDGYLRVREDVVSSLVAEVAAAARAASADLEFIELSGAVKGYATGRPTGAPAPSIAWQLGVDVTRVARACDGLSAIGYAADPERVRGDLDAYGDAAVSVIFRPTPPDCGRRKTCARKSRWRASAGYGASTSTTTASCGWTRWTGSAPPWRPERPPCEGAGVAAVVDDDDAVHDHVRDPLREPAGSS